MKKITVYKKKKEFKYIPRVKTKIYKDFSKIDTPGITGDDWAPDYSYGKEFPHKTNKNIVCQYEYKNGQKNGIRYKNKNNGNWLGIFEFSTKKYIKW